MLKFRTVGKHSSAFATVISLLLFSACAGGTYENGEFRAGKLDYRTGGLPSQWRRVSVRDANLTFHHEKGGAILANAMCDDEVDDVPLDVLTNHLLFGVDKVRELSRQTFSLDGRAAVRSKLNGEVDGVAVGMDLVVLKKDNCTFDFQLLAAPDAIESRRADFEAFFKGFATGKKAAKPQQ